MRIYKKEARQIIIGSSWFGTGGGFPLHLQQRLIDKVFGKINYIELISVDNLGGGDYICAVYGVGSAANTDVDLNKPLKKAITVMETIMKKKIRGLFGAETGIEGMIFELCATANLPMIDADCTGGRAVPEIQFDNFFILGKQITPVVAVNSKLETLLITGNRSGKYIENKIRNFSQQSKGSVAVLDHAVPAQNARDSLTLETVSRSLTLGAAISKRKSLLLDKAASGLQMEVIFKGKITDISLSDDPSGFLIGNYKIGNDKQEAEIFVKNENLILSIDKKAVITCPDLIITLDEKTMNAVHNSQLRNKQKVIIVSIPASKLWDSPAGRKLFSPEKTVFS